MKQAHPDVPIVDRPRSTVTSTTTAISCQGWGMRGDRMYGTK